MHRESGRKILGRKIEAEIFLPLIFLPFILVFPEALGSVPVGIGSAPTKIACPC
jgi:hypothetical protein